MVTAWRVSVFGVSLAVFSRIWTEYREKRSVSVQSECGKMRTRKTPNTDTFHAVSVILKNTKSIENSSLLIAINFRKITPNFTKLTYV